jgi:sugar phosphate isomerase/epimerase
MISVFSGESQESFKKYKKEFQAERKRKAPAHFAQARKSLTELIDCIGSRRIRLAVENRFWYEEFPDFGEIGALLNAFDPDKVSYWHDTSHAQAMETLEFCDQRAYLDAYGERLAGFHIGDMSFDERLNSGWLKDYAEFKTEHKSPGYGNIDFSFLRDFSQRKDIRFIFELYKSVDFSQIVSGKSRIEKILA